MNARVKVRIKRGQGRPAILRACDALTAAGFRLHTERRNGHPVNVWVR